MKNALVCLLPLLSFFAFPAISQQSTGAPYKDPTVPITD